MQNQPQSPTPEEREAAAWMSRGAGWILAGIACAALIDAAVETFLSGSPARWWVVIVAATFFAAVAVGAYMRGRPGLRLRPSVLAFGAASALLALVAATPWLPGGTTHGLVVLGQSTSRLLSLTAALGVVAAGAVLIRTTAVPRAVSVAVAVLTAYGAAAFAVAAVRETPFPAVFSGEGFWARLPWAMQGPVLSAIALLPSALAVHLWRGVQAARTEPRRWLVTLGAVGVASSLVVAGFRDRGAIVLAERAEGDRTPVQSAQPVQRAAAVPSPAQSQPAPTPEVAAAREKFQAQRERLRAALDPSAFDPRSLAARTGKEPAALTRFVQATYRYEPYTGVLRGARGILRAGAGNSADRALLLAELLKAAGHRVRFAEGRLSRADAERLVRASLSSGLWADSQEVQEIFDRTWAHVSLLGEALSEGGFVPEVQAGSRWAKAVADAEEHFWVQVWSEGRWVDADPSPGVPFGQALAASRAVHEELPPELFYTLRFRITAQRAGSPLPPAETLLEYSANASDFSGTTIGVFHERSGSTAVPVLTVGDRVVKGRGFEAPDGSITSPLTRVFERMDSPKEESRLVSERLVIGVQRNGEISETAYTIFDLDEAAPAPGARGRTRPRGGRAAADGVDAIHGLTVVTGRVHPSELAAMLAAIVEPETPAGGAKLLSAYATAYHLLRTRLSPDFLGPPAHWYIDRPNVVLARVGREGSSSRLSLDLTVKHYRTLRAPEDPLEEPGSFYDGLIAGVLDHIVERWIVDPADTSSVGALFEAAAAEDVPLNVSPFESAEHPLLTEAGSLRMRDELQKGRIVMLPSRAPRAWRAGVLGWWALDPESGWTEDCTEDGRHQAGSTEELSLLTITMRTIDGICRHAVAIGTGLAVIAAVVRRLQGLDLDPATLVLLALISEAGPQMGREWQEICDALYSLRRGPRTTPTPKLPPLPPKFKPLPPRMKTPRPPKQPPGKNPPYWMKTKKKR